MKSVADFSGRRVWITGAAQGIGHETALAFMELGAQVIGFDRHFDVGSRLPFETARLDITDRASVGDACASLLAQGCGPHTLVNAAGVLRLGRIEALSFDDWQQCFSVNVTGVFHFLQALLPHFKAQRGGSIVSVASNAAHVPRLGMAAYCASKAALASLSHCLGLELAEFGVRANLVSPGSTDTPMLRAMLGDEAAYARTVAGLPEQYKLGIPLKKIATAREVANTIVFLASDLASHITLQDMVVDGGATLGA